MTVTVISSPTHQAPTVTIATLCSQFQRIFKSSRAYRKYDRTSSQTSTPRCFGSTYGRCSKIIAVSNNSLEYGPLHLEQSLSATKIDSDVKQPARRTLLVRLLLSCSSHLTPDQQQQRFPSSAFRFSYLQYTTRWRRT